MFLRSVFCRKTSFRSSSRRLAVAFQLRQPQLAASVIITDMIEIVPVRIRASLNFGTFRGRRGVCLLSTSFRPPLKETSRKRSSDCRDTCSTLYVGLTDAIEKALYRTRITSHFGSSRRKRDVCPCLLVSSFHEMRFHEKGHQIAAALVPSTSLTLPVCSLPSFSSTKKQVRT